MKKLVLELKVALENGDYEKVEEIMKKIDNMDFKEFNVNNKIWYYKQYINLDTLKLEYALYDSKKMFYMRFPSKKNDGRICILKGV